MSELKPCPFCGGEAKLRDAICGVNITAYVVHCGNWDCKVRPTTGYRRVKKEAIEAWEGRVDNEAL